VYEYSKAQSRNGGVILEEYMTGKEVSVEIIVVDNKVNILQIIRQNLWVVMIIILFI
jgi:phosphoribosylamine-glycine ligase